MRKSTLFYLVIALVVFIIIFIYLSKGNGLSEQELRCIGQKSKLFTLTTCGHCHEQIELIQKELNRYDLDFNDIFELVVCDISEENSQLCDENNIVKVPTWIINNIEYRGVRSLENLKELTGC